MKHVLPVVGGLMLVLLALAVSGPEATVLGQNEGASIESQRALRDQYCASCHSDQVKSGGFTWTDLDVARPEQNAARAEKVIRKVRSGMMPPAGSRRPPADALKAFAVVMESQIDRAAASRPYVSAPELHRVNRTEYRNSVRDLLGVDVDVTALLPADSRSGSFDNMSESLTITPALMQGYIRAAERIAREAVGDPQSPPAMVSYDVPKVDNQLRHVEGAPFGTRGGISVLHSFVADGEYVFKLELYYGYGGNLTGARLPESLQGQQIEISIDGARAAIFTIRPEAQETEDGALTTDPIRIKAGQRRVSAAFISKFDGPVEDQYWLIEQVLIDRGIGGQTGVTSLPYLRSMFVTGPYEPTGVSDTPSRRKVFTCRPANSSEEESCATQIVSRLAAQALRRPTNGEDMEGLMLQYRLGRRDGDFEIGIRRAIQAILAKPEFVFRFERVPASVTPGQTYTISDLEVASRLAYFLWSSAPDDTLVAVASEGRLRNPDVLEQQVNRMLLDPRAEAMATNFGGQWLRLQGLKDVLPETVLFPNYTRNLGEAMRREVELLFDSFVSEDRNIAELLTADYTFVNEILAKHYRIPNVLGTRFRRVTLTDANRFGILGKAGILTMTSLANRTSPVARGKYVLEVLIGSPPPPPPPLVPPLKEATDNARNQTVAERLTEHRDSVACRACHEIMDPIGLALENFDAVGLWRTKDLGVRINPAGMMYDGTRLDGPLAVRQAVMARSDAFIGHFAENLLAYGLGRVLDYRDMPTVRSITRDAAKNNYRISSFVLGVVKSAPFQMRLVSSVTGQ